MGRAVNIIGIAITVLLNLTLVLGCNQAEPDANTHVPPPPNLQDLEVETKEVKIGGPDAPK